MKGRKEKQEQSISFGIRIWVYGALKDHSVRSVCVWSGGGNGPYFWILIFPSKTTSAVVLTGNIRRMTSAFSSTSAGWLTFLMRLADSTELSVAWFRCLLEHWALKLYVFIAHPLEYFLEGVVSLQWGGLVGREAEPRPIGPRRLIVVTGPNELDQE